MRRIGSAAAVRSRQTIGFLAVADFRSSLAQELAAGMNAAARKLDVNIIHFCAGYHYALGDTLDSSRYIKRLLPFLSGRNIDGLVSWASSLTYVMPFEEVERLHAAVRLPLVSIGMGIEGIPSLMIDNDAGTRAVMSHLIRDHGLRKIAFVGDAKGYRHNYCNEERFAVYKAALEENGICYRDERVVILADVNRREINRAVRALLEKRRLRPGRDIEAIVTTSDSISHGLMEVLKARGVQIPGEIALTGFNNTFEGIRADPPLTTVDPLYSRYGEAAIGMIMDMRDGKRVGSCTRLPVEFLVRRSCGCRGDAVRPAVRPKGRRTAAEGAGRRAGAGQSELVTSSTRDLYSSLVTDMESGSSRFVDLTQMRNTYQLGRMAFLAAEYSAVRDFREFTDRLKTHFLDFGIPGAFIVLTAEDAGAGSRIVVSLPRALTDRDDTAPGVILPKACYPRERFSLLFQLSSYRDAFMGWVVFRMGPFDIPLYDALRMITSPTLHRLIAGGAPRARAAVGREGKRITSRAILECLSRFVDEPTRVGKFARVLGVSVPTLVRRTRSLTGSSTQKLHEKIKMEKAMGMLEGREHSIAEIAESLGYRNQFYFSSVFKRYTGMPPRAWMKLRNP